MYLSWNEQTITDFSPEHIRSLYNEGYVFTRMGRGVMKQTRSVRIDLSKFALSSENRRILKKNEALSLAVLTLPYPDYHWSLGKLAKDFYDTKFGAGTFSANKAKEILTDPAKSNFNRLFVYTSQNVLPPAPVPSQAEGRGETEGGSTEGQSAVGYAICLETPDFIHYSYPFYSLEPGTQNLIPNLGMAMMLRAILYAKEQGKEYIYLGSAQRPTDTYKLQFAGLEWWDGARWQQDSEALKKEIVV